MAPSSTIKPVTPKVPVPKVGFYGCNDKIVRLTYRRARRTYPPHLKLRCPACRKTHAVAITWRKLVPADEGKKAKCLD